MNAKHNLNEIGQEDQKDIQELENRIEAFKKGKEDEERFKHYRLTRGVYGQRQLGVQMFRTKLPFGKITTEQLEALADISERYATGNLHLTTRQNIQFHYVKLSDSPAIWTFLSKASMTAREACGNTVRNITASAEAGVDPKEPFDVSPYAQAAFDYFLRNPICQDMGRKIKPAFSSNEQDSAFTYFHDFGFIPRIQEVDGQATRGFKVVIGGGLGAVSIVAHTVYEFLATDQIIPFMEACIRVFDRHGEREKRMKARMKFLIKKLGLVAFLELVETERKALPYHSYPITILEEDVQVPELSGEITDQQPVNPEKYDTWLSTNVFEQKQRGYYGVYLKVRLGNIDAERARDLAKVVRQVAADDIRLTVNQGMLLKYVSPQALPYLFNQLEALGLAAPGFDSTADITACPGTDTCALGVTNSTQLANELENLVKTQYPSLLKESNLKIKISGCMNSCGQHMAAQIGLHGSSIKRGVKVIPAMQVVLGGGVDPQGKGFVADKVIKLPTRRIPQAVSVLFDDYHSQAGEYDYFNDYFQDKGKRYFYNLLKPLADLESITEEDYQDWGQQGDYVQSIGVGECAGVMLDVVGTIINDANQKISLAREALDQSEVANAIYHTYTAFVIGAKALLLSKDIKCNTHSGIIRDFQEHYVSTGDFILENTFSDLVLQINQNEPTTAFANGYLEQAKDFVKWVIATREKQLKDDGGMDKMVIDNYYKA